ncbi:HSP20-like chaperone [Bisporella sp. PMI_857]|nr:HSP20-like chaperone [Bisporella sp. PMI_857]
MPFFPQSHIVPQIDLFTLLSELDQPTHKQCARRCTPQASTYTPSFDVTEVAHAYELYGEVPGLEQSDLEIEFSDAQTLVVKGKTSRPSPSSPTSTTAAADVSDAASEHGSEKSHNATVEDAWDEADTPLATPATTATVMAAEDKQAEKPEEKKEQAKYWVAERKVGSFARSFSFSQRIEQDAVSAELRNGVLHVVVPKSTKSRKVAIRVQ